MRGIFTKALIAAVCGSLLLARADAQEFKGQIQVGIHKVKLEAGKVYAVELDCKCSDRAFPVVECFPTQLTILFGSKIRDDRMYLMPTKSGEHTLFLVAPLGPFEEAVIDYTLTVKQLPAEFDNPLVQKTITIAADDPILPQRNARHKVETVKLKAGITYVIDLVKTKDNQDPYLYLQDANMKTLLEDDDSGGELNARIVYQPKQDGDFRILATSVNNCTGDMKLSVRMLPGKK